MLTTPELWRAIGITILDFGEIHKQTLGVRAALDDAVVGLPVGEGLDVRLRGEKVHGAALIVADQPIHLELFRVEA